MSQECVFCKIASGEISVSPLYEDDEFVAFRDLNPQAPVHVLVIPREHFPTIMEMNDSALLGRAMSACQKVARLTGVAEDGFRTVVNCRDDGGQTVYHVHFHVLGGRFLAWPPG